MRPRIKDTLSADRLPDNLLAQVDELEDRIRRLEQRATADTDDETGTGGVIASRLIVIDEITGQRQELKIATIQSTGQVTIIVETLD